jgi:hypothetical protein
MKQSDHFRENADNCAQLFEQAADEPTHQRYKTSNPADGISLDVRSKQGEKKRSFTDEEAMYELFSG